MSSRSPIHILPDAVIPAAEVGGVDDVDGTVLHGGNALAGVSARHASVALSAAHGSPRKRELPLIKRDSGSLPALPANDAIPPVPSTLCGACGGSGVNAHNFARVCTPCSGTGWELLVCEACGGDGDTHDGQDEDGSGTCDRCHGYGVRHCDEPRCRDVATHQFTERGQQYPLCRAHYLQWCADAEVEP